MWWCWGLVDGGFVVGGYRCVYEWIKGGFRGFVCVGVCVYVCVWVGLKVLE